MSRADMYQYDSAEPLECAENKSLHCRIGVTISEPFRHALDGQQWVDVEGHTIWVATSGYGGKKREAESKIFAAKYTRMIIADLDAVITELTAHRQRLNDRLAELEVAL